MRTIILSIFVCLCCSLSVSAQSADTENCSEIAKRAERAESRLKDWPDVARYHSSNVATPAIPKGANRVVFLGDSITDGWKLDQYFPGKPYINRGIGGQTTPQMLVRFRPDVIDLKPKVVVILAGTNDLAGNTGPITLEAIEGNLMSIAELARAHGILVVFSSVTPVDDHNKDKTGKQIIQTVRRPPAEILALNKWLTRYAAENGDGYIDYFSAMVDRDGFLREDITYDGLHPNAKGYEIMKPLAESAITKALSRKIKR